MTAPARCLLLSAIVSLGCGAGVHGSRGLHYVDGKLVRSPPASSRGYEAYLRARLALEADPPRLQDAMEHIEEALGYEPREPHLWTTKAEIHRQGGQIGEAMASCRRALELRPGYAPARALLAKLEDGGAPAATATHRSSGL